MGLAAEVEGKRKQSEETTDATTVRLAPNYRVHSSESGSGISFNFSRLFILSTSTSIKLYSISLLPMTAAARLLLIPCLLRFSCASRSKNI
jgi:hypothetical protein